MPTAHPARHKTGMITDIACTITEKTIRKAATGYANFPEPVAERRLLYRYRKLTPSFSNFLPSPASIKDLSI